MTTRNELVEALRLRYRGAAFSDRIRILDEFVALTCYHRKHAIRVLRGEFSPATEVRLRNRVYDEAACRRVNIIATILEQQVIEKTLTYLGLQARVLPRAPARGQVLQAA